MKFQDGEEVGRECPKCKKPLIFEMSFKDEWSDRSGHYTIDRPMIVCSDDDCDYSEDFEEDTGVEE